MVLFKAMESPEGTLCNTDKLLTLEGRKSAKVEKEQRKEGVREKVSE